MNIWIEEEAFSKKKKKLLIQYIIANKNTEILNHFQYSKKKTKLLSRYLQKSKKKVILKLCLSLTPNLLLLLSLLKIYFPYISFYFISTTISPLCLFSYKKKKNLPKSFNKTKMKLTISVQRLSGYFNEKNKIKKEEKSIVYIKIWFWTWQNFTTKSRTYKKDLYTFFCLYTMIYNVQNK